MEKPYIQLDQDFPGIVSLFMYDREVASRLTATAALSTLCSKLIEWGVDELKEKYGTKKPEEEKTK